MKKLLLLGIFSLAGCATEPETFQPAPSASRLAGQSQAWEESAYRYWQTANYQQARSLFQEAAKGHRLLDDSEQLAPVLANIAQLSIVLGDIDGAQTVLSELTALSSSLNSDELTARAALLQTNLLIENESWESAKLVANALASSSSGGIRDASLLNSAYIDLQIDGDPEVYLDQILDESLDPILYARYLRLMASIELDRGNLADADVLLERAIGIYRAEAYPPGVAASLKQLSELNLATGNMEEANRLEERARAIYKLIGNQRKSSSEW